MFGLFNDFKKKKRKRMVRRSADGTIFFVECDRFHRPPKSLEEMEAERLKKEEREKKEYAEALNYFGIKDKIFENASGEKNKFISFYREEMERKKSERVSVDLFNTYEQPCWKFIYDYRDLKIENGNLLVNSDFFVLLINFLKDIEDYVELDVIHKFVSTILSLNKDLAKKRMDLYISSNELIELLPDIYTSAKEKMQLNDRLVKFMYDELAEHIGKEHVFYYQYKLYVGEDANKKIWER